MVLGQISQINRNDVALHLPNNLTGYLPLTSISDKFTEGLETAMAEDDEGRDNDDVSDLDLTKYFSVGQYLRAYVVSTTDDRAAAGKSKRHIELSINPRQANLGLKKSDLVLGSIIQAAVASVEDHGLVMDLGLEDGAVRGFVSSKQLGQNVVLSSVKEGTVFLCLITNQKTNSKVINLSADLQIAGSMKKETYLTDAPSVDSYLPGTATEILVTEISHNGIVGKAMGLLDVTVDLIHSGAAASGKGLDKKYPIGSKVKGRIICTFPTSEQKKIGISLLDHIVHLKPKRIASQTANEVPPTEVMPLSTIVTEAKVAKVDPRLGLFVDIGVKGIRGFVHISSVSDKMIATLPESTGPYKLGSSHKARITGYNSMDALFIASLQEKIIDQPFLRLEDVEVGQVVQGTIDRIIVGATGVTGLLVSIAEGISGLVPDVHFADVVLQHPEKKFKEGGKVTARVLSTDLEKRQMRLTLKKTLVNSEAGCWKTYDELKPGMQCPGTIINIISSGAVIQFYGSVRGFLPVSEMSESYIQDPKQHFRNGQVVNVNTVSVDPLEGRMIVSCKDPTAFSEAQQEALRILKPGDIVNATVSEMTSENIVLHLEASAVKALLPVEHLADGSAQKSMSVAKKIRVNQTMTELLVLSKDESKHLVRLSSKPSLLQAASNGTLLKEFGDVVEGNEYQGFVKNITPSAVFVHFAGEMTGLLPKSQLPDEVVQTPDFGLRRNQSIQVRILSVDYQQQRFLLTTKTPVNDAKEHSETKALSYADSNLSNPVDSESRTLNDFSFGKRTKARITSVKDTQLNVELADGVQGRIDVSQLFDAWADIKDHKHPTKAFHKQRIVPVRVLGMHDSRNHRFLPITHRGRAPVFELSAKSSEVNGEGLEVLTLDKVKVGSDHVVFVNNVTADCVWVNLSPNVRGRIKAMDASDNVSLLRDLPKNFPIGSALKAKVTHVDIENNRLDLSARSSGSSKPMSLKDLSVGMVLPGRVTKVTERQLMVQLSDEISGPVQLVDLVDDYSKANPTEYQKNQTIRVCIKAIDAPNKRIYLSARPSKVLSSSLPVVDRDISSNTQIKVNDILRGFVKNVADNGVFVSLSSNVTAYVRVADLSDAYLKDWKSDFEIDQLVQGRIIAVNPELNHVQMSLRQSHLDKNYKALLTFPNMKVGQTVTGKIRNIQDFGVFVVVDGSENVSGLCHRTELSDQKGADPRKLYNEGDAVQARVLKIDPASRRISFGLKASYFITEESDEAEDLEAADDEFSGISEGEADGEVGMNGVEINGMQESESDVEDGRIEGGVEVSMAPNGGPHKSSVTKGLSAGFDWTGATLAEADVSDAHSETDNEIAEPKKKRKKKAEIKVDRTGDLDVNGPQSIADFERLLLGQPHSSILWLSYMTFQLELSEIDQAREIAERALKTINMREQDEKLNVWVALLNLENTYGSQESLEEVFKRACQYNDSQDIHERLISIYIQSGANSVSVHPPLPLALRFSTPQKAHIRTESRRPLPSDPQETHPNPSPVPKQRHLPPHHAQRPPPRTSRPPSSTASPTPAHASRHHLQVRTARIHVAERRCGAGADDVRGPAFEMAEATGSMERALGSGNGPGGGG